MRTLGWACAIRVSRKDIDSMKANPVPVGAKSYLPKPIQYQEGPVSAYPSLPSENTGLGKI